MISLGIFLADFSEMQTPDQPYIYKPMYINMAEITFKSKGTLESLQVNLLFSHGKKKNTKLCVFI